MSEATAWKVLEHGPIERLSEHLWRVEASIPNMGMRRVMSVAKLGDGRLVVHNAVALGEAEMAELDRWGEVAFVIVPNAFHRIDAPRFAARYPNAKIVCPPAATSAVSKKVAVHGSYDLLPSDQRVSMSILEGVGSAEGFMTVRDEEGATLVLNDAVFNMPHTTGVTGLVLKHVTQSSGGPRVTRVARLFLVKDKRAFAEGLVALAGTPDLKRVIVSHHEMITDAPAETLRSVAATV